MATQKKATKSAAKKPALKKAVAQKPVKKAAPAKKAAQKPAPKKVAAKPAPITKKAVAKPVAKPASKPVAKKAVAKPTPKVATKTPAKVVAKSAKKVIAKPVVKTASKKAATPVKSSKPVVTKKVAAIKTVSLPMPKKTEEKKVVAKAAPEKATPAAPKATAKNPKDIKVAPAKPVAIPKTTTKTVRKYQPDFTKSVLDQPKNDPGAPIIRYSDNDLTEFRELIQRKLGAAKKELNYLQGLITRKDEMGGDESDNRYMTMEDGSLSMEREQLSQMASRQITFIDHLEKALMRIENKTYGICRVTGKLIDKARLRAVPHATLSIEAKMGQVK